MSASARKAAMSMRRAPSRQISSRPAVISAPAVSSVTTLNIGVSFLAGVGSPACLVLVNEEGTPRPRTGGRSTGSGYNSPGSEDEAYQHQLRLARLDQLEHCPVFGENFARRYVG
jgi:hypothetical protein